MRKPMPLRWIEEAEAREVLAIARSQAPAPPSPLVATKAPWGVRVRRRWIVTEPSSPSAEEAAVPDGAVEPRRS